VSEGQPEGATPTFPLLRRIDEVWYQTERALCGALFMLMSLIVFAAVVRDVFGTRHSWLDVLVFFVIMLGAMFTRVSREGEKRLSAPLKVVIAVLLTVATGGLVELYVTLLPEGFLWASKAALCLMLWVGFLGASVATYEKQHLALEIGEKLWPKSIRHLVKAFAHALTSAACVVLLLLSIESLTAHHRTWAAADGFADVIPTLEWLPQWVVFLIFPYTFLAMAVRYLSQVVTTATKTDITPEVGPS
jgi:TRAP-type C4-dicarboxylate transport system permease small subunit